MNLREELVTLQNSYDSRENIVWGLEAQIVEREGALAWQRARVIDIEVRLDWNEVL